MAPPAPAALQAPKAAAGEDLPDIEAWPALRDLIDTVRAADPALARALLDIVVPRSAPRLGGTLLLLVAALRLGDARPLIGDRAARALESSGRREVIRRALDEFAGPAPREPAPPTDWRSVAFPFPDNGNVARAVFRWRREPEPEDGPGTQAQASTRFLIDLELSRLGPVQVDGHYRAARIDIMLRSNRPLAPDLRAEMREAVRTSLRRVGLAGGLSFQAGAAGWLSLERARGNGS